MTNASWIILSVVLLIFIYIVYQYLTTSTTTVSTVDLNGIQQAIQSSTLVGPNNLNYTIGTWIYVNSWDTSKSHSIVYAPTGTDSTAPVLVDGTNGNSTPYDFALFLDKTSPTLYFALGGSSLSEDLGPYKSSNLITITDNFPIQSWVYITVSVNTNVVDCYINGKLVISQLTQKSGIQTPSFKSAYFGNGPEAGWDAQMRNFKRYTTTMNPQDVWSNYLSQSPNTFMALSTYGVQVDLLKNGSVANTFTLV